MSEIHDIDEELAEHLDLQMRQHEELMIFSQQNLGSEVHWFFEQGAEALQQGLLLPACTSLIIGIEASLRVTIAQIDRPAPVEKLDPERILSNRLIAAAKIAGLPVAKLAFPDEQDFAENLESKKPNLRNVEIVRIRHNLCHGNILDYINKELGENNHFFTPECCRQLALNLLLVSKNWTKELGKFRKMGRDV